MENRKLVLYGAGNEGRAWLEILGAERVYCFADSDSTKVGKYVLDKLIVGIDALIETKSEISIYIDVAGVARKEIIELLGANDLTENIITTPYLGKSLFINISAFADSRTEFEGRNALLEEVYMSKCFLGYASYVSRNTVLHNVKIGRYSSVGANVGIIRGRHPARKYVSTHPIFYSTQETIGATYTDRNLFEEYRYTRQGYSVEIGNDVWIGEGAKIVEGITIADGTIVAAGAHVVKDTEPYSIIGGNPAKLIRYRFPHEEVQFLLELEWWNKGTDWIDNYAKYFTDIAELKERILCE